MPNNLPTAMLFRETCVLIAPERGEHVHACLDAITSHERAAELFGGLNAGLTNDDFWPHQDDWRASYRPYLLGEDGILQIPVKGVLLHDFPYQLGSWATGYYYIRKALERGLADPDVKGIAFVVDSPGGHVAGCFELVEKITAARGQKPMRGYAHEGAYSAAYAIIAAVDPGGVTVSRTGGVGSIGIVTAHWDYSKAMADEGVKVTFIHAGKYKVAGNPFQPLDAETKARWQERVEESYSVFVKSVAGNRGMDEDEVRATEALTFTATQAVSNKLADRIGPLDDALAEFSAALAGETSNGDNAMTKETAAPDAAAIEAASKEAAQKAAAEATTKATAEAKSRVKAIMGCDEAKTRKAAAEHLSLNTDLSLEDAKAILAGLPEDKKDEAEKPTNAGDPAFAAAMEAGKPQVGAGEDDEEKPKQSASDRILAARFGERQKA